ncbi:MAG: hypothetical protein BroJett021_22740 [Chloroflexota bacterium]|nr:SAF domain-containing protein [Caldilinea sp.]GIK73286.1 MAG: hypothetical protein BroJett021_22740 [Chloroflexota bacterium]
MLDTLRKAFPWPPTPQQVFVWILLAVGLIATIAKLVTAPTSQPVVVAARDLPAFTRLSAADVKVENRTLTNAAVLNDTALAEGRLLTAPVKSGAVLEPALLISPTIDLQDWWTLRVPISMTTMPAAGEMVLLVGIEPNASNAPLLQSPTLVLGVDGAYATVAVAPDAGASLVGYQVDGRVIIAVRMLR